MALTISAAAVDASGKYVKATIAGVVTAPLKPQHNVSGIQLRTGGVDVDLDYADSISDGSGNFVFLVPRNPIRSGVVHTIEVDAGNDLVDSAGTPTTLAAAAGVAVTNNSIMTTAMDPNEVGIEDDPVARAIFQRRTGVVEVE